MKCKFFLGVFLLLLIHTSYAQQAIFKGKVSGKDSEPVVGAFVRILNTNVGAVTDEQGNFALSSSSGKHTLYITAIGFAGRELRIEVGASENEPLDIELAEAAIELDDIVVTAQKEEGNIQYVPYSISALSSKKINEYRIWSSKDIAVVTPNLYSANPGDNRNVTSIRGITSTSYDPAVATYIDGVNQFSLDTYIAPLFDVERIEVLRGPQGTLYGRNAMGGVINIITKRPTNTFSGFAEANLGSYGQQRYSLGIRSPLVKDKLFLGVSGLYDGMDGFYTNDFDTLNFDKKHSVTGNYYLTWLVKPEWSLTLNIKHHANRNKGPFTLVGSAEDAFANPFVVNQNALTTMIDNTFNTSLNLQHTGAVVNFSSLTTYQSNYKYYEQPIDADFSPVDVITIFNNYGPEWNKVKVVSQEFKFSSPEASTSLVKWTAGTYLFHQINPVKQAFRYGEFGYYAGGDPYKSVLTTTTGQNSGLALYGQATYPISPKVDLTVGARYDFERKVQDLRVDLLDSLGTIIYPYQNDTTGTATYHAISPKASITFHLNDFQHIYGTYSRGFRTGGLTQFTGDSIPLIKYKPEYSNNFEVGIKNTFLDNRLKLNVSAFYISVKDIQVPTLILPQAAIITRNAGELTSVGAELEVSAIPIKALEIEYNLGYTNATYDKLTLPITLPDETKGGGDFSGSKQIFTPNVTSMLAIQYSPQLLEWQSLKFVVRGEWMFQGEKFFDLMNTIKQSPVHTFNARLGVSATTFDVMFWARNLSDTKYINYAYDFGAVSLGDPFNWGVTLRKTF